MRTTFGANPFPDIKILSVHILVRASGHAAHLGTGKERVRPDQLFAIPSGFVLELPGKLAPPGVRLALGKRKTAANGTY
jgi:hypothetical protein